MASIWIRGPLPSAIDWADAANKTGFDADALTVYRLHLPALSPFLPDYQRMLSVEERDRASRFHRIEDQQRFIAVRGVLRQLLATRTGQAPARIQFGSITNRKPTLTGIPDWHFNVSHSGNYALIAIAPYPVGIDLEQVNRAFDWRGVLAGSCRPAEQSFIGTGPDATDRFYQLWTRKEALLKATGQGLSDNLPAVPGLDGWHEIGEENLQTNRDWTVSNFAVAAGYVGAVAQPMVSSGERPIFQPYIP